MFYSNLAANTLIPTNDTEEVVTAIHTLTTTSYSRTTQEVDILCAAYYIHPYFAPDRKQPPFLQSFPTRIKSLAKAYTLAIEAYPPGMSSMPTAILDKLTQDADVQILLLANKIQAKKKSNPQSEELLKYFDNWIKYLCTK